jgi:hypothetical protein
VIWTGNFDTVTRNLLRWFREELVRGPPTQLSIY